MWFIITPQYPLITERFHFQIVTVSDFSMHHLFNSFSFFFFSPWNRSFCFVLVITNEFTSNGNLDCFWFWLFDFQKERRKWRWVERKKKCSTKGSFLTPIQNDVRWPSVCTQTKDHVFCVCFRENEYELFDSWWFWTFSFWWCELFRCRLKCLQHEIHVDISIITSSIFIFRWKENNVDEQKKSTW